MPDPYKNLDRWVIEQVLRACARLLYERTTGRDWHTASTDPGLDPIWRQRAQEER